MHLFVHLLSYSTIEHIFVLGGGNLYFTHLEEYILQLFNSLSINNPDQLSLEQIAEKLNIEVRYTDFSMCYNETIFLSKSDKRREWQEFGHEICHYLRHSGNQVRMHPLFVELQEYQADFFAYHFCIPTFMLEDLYNFNVYNIMQVFDVEYAFARRRLEIHANKLRNTISKVEKF